MDNHRDDAADVLVIFGIIGDLARRMTFRALYRLERRGLLDCPIMGVASDDITTEQLVKHAREAIVDSGQDVDDAVFDRLARRMSYLSGDVSDAALYRSLAAGIGDRQRPVYYLEVPPSLFGPIVERLGAAKLLRDGRVAVEKPFGRDLASARELDARLHRLLRESQILRVDHFLGKEPVVELEYLRFANVALAELWDRKSVSCVQITMAEDFGVEGRGRFYDSVCALSDVVQNHLLQVLALVAMDPPAGASAGDTQDKKAEVFRTMPPADPQHCSRCSTTRPTSAPTRAGPGDLRRRKPCSAATRAGSSRGCPRRAESVNCTSPQAGDGVDLRIRLIRVGRLAHPLAALQGRA